MIEGRSYYLFIMDQIKHIYIKYFDVNTQDGVLSIFVHRLFETLLSDKTLWSIETQTSHHKSTFPPHPHLTQPLIQPQSHLTTVMLRL